MERSRLLIIWSTPGAKSDTVDVETVEAEIDVVGMMLGVGRDRKVRLGDAGMWGWEDGGMGGWGDGGWGDGSNKGREKAVEWRGRGDGETQATDGGDQESQADGSRAGVRTALDCFRALASSVLSRITQRLGDLTRHVTKYLCPLNVVSRYSDCCVQFADL